MLCLGDGSKTVGAVKLGSVNPKILRYFVWGLRHLYHIDENRLALSLRLIPAARFIESHLMSWWASELDVSLNSFRKTTYDKRSKAWHVDSDYHGVCRVSYADTYLQLRILAIAKTCIKQVTGSQG